MDQGILAVKNVVKSYSGKQILKGVSFEAKPGEFIVLVGPSGCGKSTLLRSIAGLEQIDEGSLTIGDRDVAGLPPKDRNVAMVFQDYALYPHMTVAENISFGLKIRKFPAEEIHKRVEAAAEKLELTSLLQRKPKELSGGQRQRVAIGRAIVRKPDVFLFDEPLSNLDAKLRGQMRIRIAKLHHELKTTAVYVTHDQTEAMTLADRIIVLNGGHIQQVGRPLDLYNNPANTFVATFIGSPAMNLIEGHLATESGQTSFRTPSNFSFKVPERFVSELKSLSGVKNVTWGMRPECLSLADGEDSADWHGTVEVVEPLGASTSVICNVDGQELQVSFLGGNVPVIGDKVPLKFVGKSLYAFDTSTGDSIRS